MNNEENNLDEMIDEDNYQKGIYQRGRGNFYQTLGLQRTEINSIGEEAAREAIEQAYRQKSATLRHEIAELEKKLNTAETNKTPDLDDIKRKLHAKNQRFHDVHSAREGLIDKTTREQHNQKLDRDKAVTNDLRKLSFEERKNPMAYCRVLSRYEAYKPLANFLEQFYKSSEYKAFTDLSRPEKPLSAKLVKKTGEFLTQNMTALARGIDSDDSRLVSLLDNMIHAFKKFAQMIFKETINESKITGSKEQTSMDHDEDEMQDISYRGPSPK